MIMEMTVQELVNEIAEQLVQLAEEAAAVAEQFMEAMRALAVTDEVYAEAVAFAGRAVELHFTCRCTPATTRGACIRERLAQENKPPGGGMAAPDRVKRSKI